MEKQSGKKGNRESDSGRPSRRPADFVRQFVILSHTAARWTEKAPPRIAEDLRRLVSDMMQTEAVTVRLDAPGAGSFCDGDPAAGNLSGGHRSRGSVRIPIGANGVFGCFTVATDRPAFPTPVECALLEAAAMQSGAAMAYLKLAEEFQRTRRLLAAQAAQQSVMTRLGVRFLTAIDVPELLSETLCELRECLHVDFCEAFELDASAKVLVLRAADGWPDGTVGVHRVSAEADCEVGFSITSSQPVIVTDHEAEPRFKSRALPESISVRSGITVAIPGSRIPFGAIGVHTIEMRAFSSEEVLFLQSVANLLATALRHRQAEMQREAMLAQAAAARESAERASTVKTTYLGMVSHELRTPLNAIGGYVQLLEAGMRGPLADEQRADIVRIGRNQRYLLGLIENVLSYLSLEGGRVRYTLEEVHLEDLVLAVEDALQPLIDAKGLVYERRLTGTSRRIVADRRKLQQILINLLGNAVKFTPNGGRLLLECAASDETVRFHVHDSGVGIPADRIASLFEPFTRLRSEAGPPGTGLGLSISREFAMGMGGNIIACSEPGKGSVFTVLLPRRAS